MGKDNRSYYDAFSAQYEKERYRGYHKFIDDMEAKITIPYCRNRRVLEAGCGTGLVLDRIREHASEAVGFDLSHGMLKLARNKDLKVIQGDMRYIPFADESFDTVCSYKVLSHLQNPTKILGELSRVTKRGGHLVLEFYNRNSLRYLIRRIRPALKTSTQFHEAAIFTKFYTLDEISALLPSDLEIVEVKGVRGVTVVPQVLRLPFLGELNRRAENRFTFSPLSRYGGFLMVIVQKK